SKPGETVAPAFDPNTTIVNSSGAPAAAAPPGTGSPSFGLATPAATRTVQAATTTATNAPGESSAVRLGAIATVPDDVENRRGAGWFDGDRTVMVIVRRTAGANILDVISRVKALLPQLSRTISPA